MGITVSGTGESSGRPDVVDIDVGVSVLANTVEEAASVAADRARAVTSAFTTAGISSDDLATTEYSIRPEYDYSGNEQKLAGYRVSNIMRARLRDIDTTGAVLDAVSDAGGDETRVNGLTFGVDDESALRAEARETAWKDAMAKATQLADLSGQTLGNATSITETERPPVSPVRMLAADMAERSTPIQPGSTTVTVTLEVVFATGERN
jgi:uncharacterized protein YggE